MVKCCCAGPSLLYLINLPLSKFDFWELTDLGSHQDFTENVLNHLIKTLINVWRTGPLFSNGGRAPGKVTVLSTVSFKPHFTICLSDPLFFLTFNCIVWRKYLFVFCFGLVLNSWYGFAIHTLLASAFTSRCHCCRVFTESHMFGVFKWFALRLSALSSSLHCITLQTFKRLHWSINLSCLLCRLKAHCQRNRCALLISGKCQMMMCMRSAFVWGLCVIKFEMISRVLLSHHRAFCVFYSIVCFSVFI